MIPTDLRRANGYKLEHLLGMWDNQVHILSLLPHPQVRTLTLRLFGGKSLSMSPAGTGSFHIIFIYYVCINIHWNKHLNWNHVH